MPRRGRRMSTAACVDSWPRLSRCGHASSGTRLRPPTIEKRPRRPERRWPALGCMVGKYLRLLLRRAAATTHLAATRSIPQRQRPTTIGNHDRPSRNEKDDFRMKDARITASRLRALIGVGLLLAAGCGLVL